MTLKNQLSAVLVISLLLFLVALSFINTPETGSLNEIDDSIRAVGQGGNVNMDVDLHITATNITINESAYLLDDISIVAKVTNLGNDLATNIVVILYLEHDYSRTELERKTINNIVAGQFQNIDFLWSIPADTMPGEYNLIIKVENESSDIDQNPDDNEAFKTITINSFLTLKTYQLYIHPGKTFEVFAELTNDQPQILNTTLEYYYYPVNVNKSQAKLINSGAFLEAQPHTTAEVVLYWQPNQSVPVGNYIFWAKIVNASDSRYINVSGSTTLKFLEPPDTSKTPVYFQLWFIIGLIALIIFFLTIIFSLIGVIPQDRLPIQPALVVMALVIMILGFVGNYLDPSVHLIGAQDIAGMVIMHPITALTAGFLVAGGLEAAGAFTAAADALGRIEKLKFKGKTIFGFTGTVVILTNIPTLIAMPCGRILGAALMPAALFFGYRVARSTGDARMVGVVVFPFIVNAAASCGPSPLGGIGTIGEGLSKMPIGSFTSAQSTGIMICTGVCALFMRFITPMRPADLSDEDIRRQKEAEKINENTDKNDLDSPGSQIENKGLKKITRKESNKKS